MKPRTISDNISWLGFIDRDRRLFDSLIPLPDGTSYNAYLVKGSEKTALIDSVDPAHADTLMEQLEGIGKIDFIVSQHAEQDHSGAIPKVLEKYPDAIVFTTPKGKDLLIDHLHLPEDKIRTVQNNENLSLGDKTLQFIYTPWVHWPETMCTYVPENRILFTCDFFGSHIASTDLFVRDKSKVAEAAKRYYAEIMMPFRSAIKKNIAAIEQLDIDLIAPSHGSLYDEPRFIIDEYKTWIADTPGNLVVIPYISMHGSTRVMVEHLVASLAEHGVTAQQFDLAVTDLGKLAISLVDAATIIIGTPTVHVAPHPAIFYASFLANALRPKAKFASVIGSYGWSTKAVEKIAEQISNLRVEILTPIVCKGFPGNNILDALDEMAQRIAEKHKELGILQ
ncbi:MAG: FprA family A-type flavoprotein [Chitinispirillaceae bacterium]|nr:FprA family A-type flavoprotein [Chitinispirillaceae bacterium]